MHAFEELEVWKEARKFRMAISAIVKQFPKQETYMLANQMLRSSRSVPANIAEGFGRFHFQENIQFCRQARGSLTETMDHIICAYDEKLIDIQTCRELRLKYQTCLRLLNGYISYLKKSKSDGITNNR